HNNDASKGSQPSWGKTYTLELSAQLRGGSSMTVEGSAKYDILVKLRRSDKEEKYKANMHKDYDGKFHTVEGSAKYDILVKLRRSDKEEKYKANMHKDYDGKFHVNNMVQDHS
nr:cystatin B [Tanacetum cinerariifolium]